MPEFKSPAGRQISVSSSVSRWNKHVKIFPNMQICKDEYCFLNLIILPSCMSYASVPPEAH